MSPSFTASCGWLTAHCHHMKINTTNFLVRTIRISITKASGYLSNFINKVGIGSVSVAVFAAIVARQIQSHATFHSVTEISKVSGLYGPGCYYGWLINDIVAVYESIHNQETEGLNSGMFIVTLGVSVQPSIADISQLRCVARLGTCSQAQFDAFDRLIMVSWINTMHYLLQRMVYQTKNRQEPPTGILTWRPCAQTAVRIILEILNTIAMVAYDIQRGTLGKRLLLCLGPFLSFIVMPLATVYKKNQWQWATSVINAGSILISVIYICLPYEYRYDPHSPAAPLSAAKLTDDDQVEALVTGCLCVLLHVLKYFRPAKVWAKKTVQLTRVSYNRLARRAHGQRPHTLEEGRHLATENTAYDR